MVNIMPRIMNHRKEVRNLMDTLYDAEADMIPASDSLPVISCREKKRPVEDITKGTRPC